MKGRKAFLLASAFLPPLSMGLHASAAANDPFVISVEGEEVTEKGDRVRLNDKQSRIVHADSELEKSDVRVTFDGLDVKPLLNVSTVDSRVSYRAGEEIGFLATTNYPAYIDHAEIVVTARQGVRTEDVAKIPVDPNGATTWTMPDDKDAEYSYLLRVYDANGRFDETEPLPLNLTAKADPLAAARQGVAPGWGEDRTAKRNIRVHGGAVTISGRNVPSPGGVTAMGEDIPIDPQGDFVVQRILPPGDHSVDVVVNDGLMSKEISRDINIPANDWFYVGLADITIGRNTGSPGIETVKDGEFDKVYTKGRFAFYLKGKIKGEYLLTAAADTGEGKLSTLFKGLDEKDARSFLRRLDPDDYYPVYGDDSTFEEDAPTKGKFYVKLQKGDSHVMWGNFKTKIRNTKFLASERALYGASARYRSPQATSFGERKVDVALYAAQPGTLPQRDVLRGTGGSAYFLKHQDITTGSETVSAEVRDPITGMVVERIILTEGEDYDIDYIQGVIILRKPLASMTGNSGPVRSGAIGDGQIFLIVQYEYTPAAGEVDGYVYGGRAEAWINDRVRIGFTGMSEKTGTADQQAGGADFLLRHSDKTFLEGEIAASRGPGFSSSYSTDGGITITDSGIAGALGKTALAWRMRGEADLSEVTGGRLSGNIGGYYEQRQKGFETLAESVKANQRIWGAFANAQLSEKDLLKLKYDDYSDADGKTKREGRVSVEHTFNDRWKGSVGIQYTDLADPATTKPGYNGSRVDAGVRLEYRFDPDRMVYAFGQATLARHGDIRHNDRGGVGAVYRLTDKVSLNGEVSYGTGGWGGLASVDYDPNADTHYYFGYRLDPDRIWTDAGTTLYGTNYGAFVAGMRRKLNDEWSAFSESDLDMFGKRRSLTQTYGVTYTPTKAWTITAGFESGRINDSTIDPASGVEFSDFSRTAISASLGYFDADKGLKARMRGEYRRERSQDGTRDMDSWLGGFGFSYDPTPDWRILANADAVFSDSLGTNIRDGKYAEVSVGAAYRPVDNNRFNMLFKYTWLYDLPGPDQVNLAGDLLGAAQRSHILSVDVNYNVTPWLTLGAKYGMRLGQTRERTETGWSNSDAHLGILRADVHIVKKWDAVAELRALHLRQSKSTQYGALVGLYRHVGENFKIGVGYNAGKFTDDLRDVKLNHRGFFVNAIGKF